MMIIGGLGLLLFGKRLPEVGRSLGKGIVEFKRGLKGISDEIEDESSKPAALPKPAQEPEARRLETASTAPAATPSAERVESA